MVNPKNGHFTFAIPPFNFNIPMVMLAEMPAKQPTVNGERIDAMQGHCEMGVDDITILQLGWLFRHRMVEYAFYDKVTKRFAIGIAAKNER